MTASTQTTLARATGCTGIGLHSGRPVHARLLPAPANTGLVFRRLAGQGRARTTDIRALATSVGRVDHATTLTAQTPEGRLEIQTIEHLLAALAGLGVDNCLIELDADEVPILDGSSAPWCYLIREAGVRAGRRPRLHRRVLRSVTIEDGASRIAIHPADSLRVSCSIDFEHAAIGRQEISLTVTPRSFGEQLAPARTFGFLRDVETLRAAGLVKGGSRDNAIVLDEHEVLNGRLRYRDEFVRHKALDLVGDLALAGHPVLGHVVAHRAGHRLHVELTRRLLEEPGLSCVEERTEAQATGLATPLAVGG